MPLVLQLICGSQIPAPTEVRQIRGGVAGGTNPTFMSWTGQVNFRAWPIVSIEHSRPGEPSVRNPDPRRSERKARMKETIRHDLTVLRTHIRASNIFKR